MSVPAAPTASAAPATPDAPVRHLPLQGASNFRDLGGYPTRSGRALRWRRLFRSDHLGQLTPADQAALAAFALQRTFDFRGIAEREATPCRLGGVTRHALAIEPSVVQRLHQHGQSGAPITAAAVRGFMHELYEGLIADQGHRWAEMFEHLLASDAPAVLHCTAGKDRTGVAVALVLLALEVPREQVRADFLLSHRTFRPAPSGERALPHEALEVLWGVEAGFLDAALRRLDAEPGGLDGYLERRLGLTAAARRRLAELYLA